MLLLFYFWLLFAVSQEFFGHISWRGDLNEGHSFPTIMFMGKETHSAKTSKWDVLHDLVQLLLVKYHAGAYFTPISSVVIVYFEQVFVCWEITAMMIIIIF